MQETHPNKTKPKINALFTHINENKLTSILPSPELTTMFHTQIRKNERRPEPTNKQTHE